MNWAAPWILCVVVTSLLPRDVAANQCEPGSMTSSTNSDDINIAVLLPIPANCSEPHSRLFSSCKTQAAIELAVERLSGESDVNGDGVRNDVMFEGGKVRTFAVRYADSGCDISISTNHAFNFYMRHQVPHNVLSIRFVM